MAKIQENPAAAQAKTQAEAEAAAKAAAEAAEAKNEKILRDCLPLIAASGLRDDRAGPADLDLDQQVAPMALQLGRYCCAQNIFLQSDHVVTVASDGAVRLVGATRFVSWIESDLRISPFRLVPGAKGKLIKKRKSMSQQRAKEILAADVFRQCLRPLRGVNLVRLPARDAEGEIRLLEAGYDAATQTFTVDGLSYAHDWTLERSNRFVEELLGEFPWSEEADDLPSLWERLTAEEPLGLRTDGPASRRSAAVTWGLAVGFFCRNLIKGARPMGLFAANQPGSGKTRLAQIAAAPVFGLPYESDLPTNDDEMGKTLSTESIAMSPYVFFDDIGRVVSSNKLNRFISGAGHTGRLLGGQTKFSVENVSQVLATGNWVSVTSDLRRRCLIAELFLPGEVAERTFKQELTAEVLATDEWRAQALSALWGFVRHWQESGCPQHPRPLPSFESCTRLVGGVLGAAGWTDLLAPASSVVGGDELADDVFALIYGMVTRLDTDDESGSGAGDEGIILNYDEIHTEVVRMGLEELTFERDDTHKKLGRRLAVYKGRLWGLGDLLRRVGEHRDGVDDGSLEVLAGEGWMVRFEKGKDSNGHRGWGVTLQAPVDVSNVQMDV